MPRGQFKAWLQFWLSFFQPAKVPRERGLIENTNGLLRQYFPKAMAFDQLTQKMVDDAVAKINNRPRKTLDYDTAANRMDRSLPILAA